jgi:hypothetical protein
MDIHQIMESVAELEGGKYQREGEISILHEPIQGGRQQVVYGKVRQVGGIDLGFLFTKVGPNMSKVDPIELLKLNYYLQYSKLAITKDNIVCIIAFFDTQKTSAQMATEIIREVAQIGDRLEKNIFSHDNC